MSDTIYCDGGCNKLTGKEAWGSVILKDQEGKYYDLLSKVNDRAIRQVQLPTGPRHIVAVQFDDVKNQQNNGAELAALVLGLQFAIDLKIKKVCSDSDTLIKWWSKGQVNAKTRAKMDPKKLELIQQCKKLREQFEKEGGELIKISGDENPADLGFH